MSVSGEPALGDEDGDAPQHAMELIDAGAGPDEVAPPRWPSPLAIAACASIGAGGIHAAFIGTYSSHRLLATLLVWAAALQVVWGVATLLRPSRVLAGAGMVVNLALVVAWMVTRVRGVSWISGLEVRQQVQFADSAGAVLAIVAAGIAFGVLLTPGSVVEHRLANLSIPAFLVAALALPAMVTGGTRSVPSTAPATGGHQHAAAVDTSSNLTALGLDQPATTAVAAPDDTAQHEHDTSVASGASTGPGGPTTTAAPAVVPPVPYDPTKPIDLSGIAGVTPEEQARAENLVAITLARLPKFADPAVATKLGWQSIGDGITGYEHFINWKLIDDTDILDPDFPEAIVYQVEPDGSRKLVSAMFILPKGYTLDNVPDVGGKLVQWHVHDNLCFTADPVAPRVAGLTRADGTCPAPLVKFDPQPMIHVWIVPNVCGPFAALEGVGAGQVKAGEAHWCDHVHGSTTTFG